MMEQENEDAMEQPPQDAFGQPEDGANKGLFDKLLGRKKEVRRRSSADNLSAWRRGGGLSAKGSGDYEEGETGNASLGAALGRIDKERKKKETGFAALDVMGLLARSSNVSKFLERDKDSNGNSKELAKLDKPVMLDPGSPFPDGAFYSFSALGYDDEICDSRSDLFDLRMDLSKKNSYTSTPIPMASISQVWSSLSNLDRAEGKGQQVLVRGKAPSHDEAETPVHHLQWNGRLPQPVGSRAMRHPGSAHDTDVATTPIISPGGKRASFDSGPGRRASFSRIESFASDGGPSPMPMGRASPSKAGGHFFGSLSRLGSDDREDAGAPEVKSLSVAYRESMMLFGSLVGPKSRVDAWSAQNRSSRPSNASSK